MSAHNNLYGKEIKEFIPVIVKVYVCKFFLKKILTGKLLLGVLVKFCHQNLSLFGFEKNKM